MPPDRSYSYTGVPSSSSLQNKGEGSSAGAISPPPPALPRARAISVSVKPSSPPTTKPHHANSNGQSDDRRIQSASPPSAMSPPARDGAAPVKQQKACIHCRKSKVKCQHEGGPPCRRCIDGNLECKFRLRADDENWRERTDETLSKLSTAVDALLHRGSASSSSGQPIVYPHMPPPALPSPRQAGHPYSPAVISNTGAPPLPPSNMYKSSPRSDHSGAMDYSASPRGLAFPRTSFSNGESSNSESDLASQHQHRRTSSLRMHELNSSNLAASGSSPPTSAGPSSSHRYSTSSSMSMAYPSLPQIAIAPPRLPDHSQALPSSLLQAITADSTPFYLTNPLPMRWTSGITSRESYGSPAGYIGRDDPRLTCISRNIIPLEKLRAMFRLFAERLQPHSFGFPTFPANEHMTPLIISAIAMAGSLHDSECRKYFPALRVDVLGALPQHELSEDHHLDPEQGIGVEEITGACIAASWLGGEDAYRLARTARWWALAYLRQFDLQTAGRTVTLGEALTILPPFRNIDMSAKLRIWLESYLVDGQQAFMTERTPLTQGQTSAHYCDTLRSTLLQANSSTNGGQSSTVSTPTQQSPSSAGGLGGGAGRIHQHDRQLMGHALLLDILLEAQRGERQASHMLATSSASWHDGSREELVSGRLNDLWAAIDAVDRWRERVGRDEDLSAATPSSMDLTFMYGLARAYIGSLALTLDPPPLPPSSPSVPTPAHHHHLIALHTSQVNLVNLAKSDGLQVLESACEVKGRGFGDRIAAMPIWYHFLLSHTVGFLLRLIQRKVRFLLAREAKYILMKVEPFVQLYHYELFSSNLDGDVPSSANVYYQDPQSGSHNGSHHGGSSDNGSQHTPGATGMDATTEGGGVAGGSNGEGSNAPAMSLDGSNQSRAMVSSPSTVMSNSTVHPAMTMVQGMILAVRHVKSQSRG